MAVARGAMFALTAPAGDAGWVVYTLLASAGAGAATFVVLRLAERAFRRHRTICRLLDRSRWPLAAAAVAIAFRVALIDVPASGTAAVAARQSTAIVIAVALTWTVVRWMQVAEERLLGNFDVSIRDNRRARQIVTQVKVLRRVATVIAVVVGTVIALRSTDWGRELGTSLLASAGVIGAILGFAGRSTLGNLIAGVQIAMTGSIRFDDAVVVEGEWGKVEEITLTNVVVRIWDQRRLVLPATYFIEEPFQNWTRRSAELIGTVELWVDFATPLDEMRRELDRLARASTLWDGQVVRLQVTDAGQQSLKVRALVSAEDSGATFDLRCEIREGLARWLAHQHPSGLPRVRVADGDGQLERVVAGSEGRAGGSEAGGGR